MKIKLNTTQKTRDRYYLISGSMGSYGNPVNHANHKFQICNGIDRGNGYQGYMSVSYFLTVDYISQEMKNKVTDICKSQNLIYS